MPNHLHPRFGIFLQAVGHLEQVIAQVGPNLETVDGKQDILRHGQDQPVAGIDDLHVIAELLAQFGLLLVERIADCRAAQGPDRAAEQGTSALVVAHGGPGGRPDRGPR